MTRKVPADVPAGLDYLTEEDVEKHSFELETKLRTTLNNVEFQFLRSLFAEALRARKLREFLKKVETNHYHAKRCKTHSKCQCLQKAIHKILIKYAGSK